MSTPIVGRSGKVLKDDVPIGYARGVTTNLSAEVVKDYSVDDVAPAVLESGNQTYTVSIEKLFVDSEFAQLLLDGTKFDIEVGPKGTTPPGGVKITLNDVVMTSWKIETPKMTGAVIENIEAEAASVTIGTYE